MNTSSNNPADKDLVSKQQPIKNYYLAPAAAVEPSKTIYESVLVDAGGYLVGGGASLSDGMANYIAHYLVNKGVNDASLFRQTMTLGERKEAREFDVLLRFNQEGDGAIVALDCRKFGNDMAMSWRVFEKNPKIHGKEKKKASLLKKVGIGTALLVTAPLAIAGAGVALLGASMGAIGAGVLKDRKLKQQSSNTTFGQMDTIFFATSVIQGFIETVSNAGIPKNRLVEVNRQGIKIQDLINNGFGSDAAAIISAML